MNDSVKSSKEPRTKLTNEQLQSLFDDAERNSPENSEPFLVVTYSGERADCAESDRHMHPDRSSLCNCPKQI